MLRYTSFIGFKNEMPVSVQALASNDLKADASVVKTIVEQKLNAAESFVDGYLQTRYSVPVKSPDGTIPEIVAQAVYTIAKYYLYQRRNAITADVQAQYDNIVSWLKDVSKGNANIDVRDEDGVSDTSFETEIIVGESNPQIFGGGWQ